MKSVLLMIILCMSTFAVAAAGEGVRGGGDTTADSPVWPQQVIENISKVKQPLRYFFNYNDSGNYWHSLLGTHYNQFFKRNDGKTPQQILETIRFVPKVNGPCIDIKDEHNAPHDGTAFNTNPEEVCMSVDNLVAKETYANSFSKIVGLAAHEFVHRMLGSAPDIEAIAVGVQGQAEAAFSGNLSFEYFNENLSTEVKDAISGLSYFEKHQGQNEYTCAAAVSMSAVTERIIDEDSGETIHMIQIVPQADFDRMIMFSNIHAENLPSYCGQEDMPEKSEIIKTFASRSEISAREYVKTFWKWPSAPASFANEPVTYIKYHDDQALEIEVARIKAHLLAFQQALKNESVLTAKEEAEGKEINTQALNQRKQVEQAREQEAAEQPMINQQKAFAKTVSDFEQNSIVRENDVPGFDAVGFAMALKMSLNADQVVVNKVTRAPLRSAFVSSEKKLVELGIRAGIPDQDNIAEQIVDIQLTVTKNGQSHFGKGSVWVDHDINGLQIAWFPLSSTGYPSFTWWDQWGQKYDPHFDNAKGPTRNIGLRIQDVHLNYKLMLNDPTQN